MTEPQALMLLVFMVAPYVLLAIGAWLAFGAVVAVVVWVWRKWRG